jgi:hypothetical protein
MVLLLGKTTRAKECKLKIALRRKLEKNEKPSSHDKKMIKELENDKNIGSHQLSNKSYVPISFFDEEANFWVDYYKWVVTVTYRRKLLSTFIPFMQLFSPFKTKRLLVDESIRFDKVKGYPYLSISLNLTSEPKDHEFYISAYYQNLNVNESIGEEIKICKMHYNQVRLKENELKDNITKVIDIEFNPSSCKRKEKNRASNFFTVENFEYNWIYFFHQQDFKIKNGTVSKKKENCIQEDQRYKKSFLDYGLFFFI